MLAYVAVLQYHYCQSTPQIDDKNLRLSSSPGLGTPHVFLAANRC